MSRYTCFPDVFYVICAWDDEGINFEIMQSLPCDCNYFIKEVSLVGCEIIPKTEDSI